MDTKKFFAELQRRNVYRAAVAYGVFGWLLVQIATQVFPFFDVPAWVIRLIVLLLLLGFPIVAFMAWIFDLTPEGLRRTGEAAPGESATRGAGRKIDFAIIAVLLAVIAFMAFQYFNGTPRNLAGGVPEKSIAVLPFADLSASQDQEYFGDGLTEQIIDTLSGLHGLFVVARTSALAFRHKGVDIREAGRILRVNLVLEGSVRRGPGTVRIDARLIDVATGYQLWSETYDSTEKEFLILQSDVARRVGRGLQVKLGLAESKSLSKTPTQIPQAYDFYLRGRFLLEKRTVDSIQKGRAFFEKAVKEDPRFALGHAGLADVYILLGIYGEISNAEASKLAWPEISSALALDDNLAEAYVSRGMLLADFELNSAEAEKNYRKAIELKPNNAEAHHWYAMNLADLGRFDEALDQILVAQQQDPLSPIIRAARAEILFFARRYDEAIDQGREALGLEANFPPALYVLAQAYASQHRFPEAVETARKFAEDESETNLILAYVYAAAGMREEAETIVRAAKQAGEFSSYEMATVCAALGDVNGAIGWLQKDVERRSLLTPCLRVDPRLDNVRPDPRFSELVARLVPRQPPPG